MLLDLTLIKFAPSLYYGGGVGSGVAFDFNDGGSGLPNIVFSPLGLANIHGVVGRDFGGVKVEGLLRLGLSPRVEARVSFPLN